MLAGKVALGVVGAPVAGRDADAVADADSGDLPSTDDQFSASDLLGGII